jgi:Flp pilus assembly protein TadG
MMGARATRARRDRGSVSAWVVIMAAMTMFMLVLLVDGGEAMMAKVRVSDIAEQGARAAADDVSTNNLRSDGTVTLAKDYCAAAQTIVSSYAASSQLDLVGRPTCPPVTATADFPELVSVRVEVRFNPLIPIPGLFQSFDVTSVQSATVFCGTATTQVNC